MIQGNGGGGRGGGGDLSLFSIAFALALTHANVVGEFLGRRHTLTLAANVCCRPANTVFFTAHSFTIKFAFCSHNHAHVPTVHAAMDY